MSECGKIKNAYFGDSAARYGDAFYWSDIKKVYGKPAYEIAAPEGHEFTGEFRGFEEGELYLHPRVHDNVMGPTVFSDPISKRLILRKKEEKKEQLRLYPQEVVARKKEAITTYTAAEVFERYGRDLLSMYGYFNSGTRNNLIDYPGFAFTGRFEHVASKAWYLNYDGPKQNTSPYALCGLYLTLTPTEEPLPRIVSYNLMEATEFEEDEARYLPNEKGEMTVVDPKEVPAVHYYERQEAA